MNTKKQATTKQKPMLVLVSLLMDIVKTVPLLGYYTPDLTTLSQIISLRTKEISAHDGRLDIKGITSSDQG